MKQYILYIVFGFSLLSCKTDKKTTSDSLASTAVIDSVKVPSQEKPKSLKEKLIGKKYNQLSNIKELEKYSTGWFLLRERNSDSGIYIIKCNEKNGNLKVVISKGFDESSEQNIILDLIEIEEFTKSMSQEEINNLDIFSDILIVNERVSNLIALAVYEEAEVINKVYKIWRVNLKTGKFEEVKDISGITVVNEDY
ncbi:hypothetical protein [Aquimarina longa]|uniref:hypothetical protein n=1 Tax=Aquimarina longa TaxID=1080221 RepID=UPI000A52907A|nr:hypothetical protein [Aquimarina longa]